MLTMKQLEKFVSKRNKSGHDSNLQFQIDADACGFEVADLGDVRRFIIDGFHGYEWKPVVASISIRCHEKRERVWLVEFGRRLYINDHDDGDTRSMFELMKKAEYQEQAA